MDGARRPIGYYLKLLDRRIEDRFATDLAAEGLSRRHWQVLETVQAGPVGDEALAEALRPFWTEAGPALATVLDDLVTRGAIAHDGGVSTLTATGRDLHASARERVTVTRRRLLDGLTPEDYARTVDTLRRMAENMAENLATG